MKKLDYCYLIGFFGYLAALICRDLSTPDRLYANLMRAVTIGAAALLLLCFGGVLLLIRNYRMKRELRRTQAKLNGKPSPDSAGWFEP